MHDFGLTQHCHRHIATQNSKAIPRDMAEPFFYIYYPASVSAVLKRTSAGWGRLQERSLRYLSCHHRASTNDSSTHFLVDSILFDILVHFLTGPVPFQTPPLLQCQHHERRATLVGIVSLAPCMCRPTCMHERTA